MNSKLTAYAKGDGAIHFAYISDGKQLDHPVSVEDAQKFVVSDPAAKKLNWSVILLNGVPVYFPPVVRISPQSLVINGELVQYVVHSSLLERATNHLSKINLTVKIKSGTKFVNANASVCDHVRFFLNHEHELTPAPSQVKQR